MAAIVGAVAYAIAQLPVPSTIVAASRTAYGHLRVLDSAESRRLLHGTTEHGSQTRQCFGGNITELCGTPTSYYAAGGVIDSTLATIRRSKSGTGLSVTVVGLGAGTIAAYCGEGDSFRFIEIDPVVVTYASKYFRFLEHAQGRCATLTSTTGDGRIQLRSQPKATVDVLILDAFSSDSVPSHLLTTEAVAEFARVLTTEGVLLYHISNRYFDLGPILAAAAHNQGLESAIADDPGQASTRRQSSRWLVMSRYIRPALQDLIDRGIPSSPAGPAGPWTDERHSIWSIVRPIAARTGGGR